MELCVREADKQQRRLLLLVDLKEECVCMCVCVCEEEKEKCN